MFAPRDPVQSAIARRERKRSRRYGGFAGGGMANQPVEASGLFRTIASIGSAETKAATEMMGRSLSQVTAEINRQAAASNGSINSLQAQRTAFAQLRAGLDPTSQDFRELGKEIEKVDRRLEKLNKRRRRPTIGGIAQGLGGIAAGGVFGGPEGALGAAVGGAVGGVAGVAAGAALGAQVKMMREALGATSEYAAQLQKLEIALKGVAGPEYTNALKAANQVTKDFNVPIDVSTRGITRLSAAVVGAGGNVADAEVVFRNITSAIKATGGGAQDVDSAITAMVQTFSKGKVSAEELSGQLGERLPGAVTKFAEANEMTLPELQKSLKAGTVGLDELMKFIISLGPEYEETARAIADSSADAGARAAVAFDQVRREVGEALQPIGAQLQQAFAEFVLEILPAIKAGAVAAANGLNALLDASSFLIANFRELLIIAGAGGIVLALQNLVGIAAALGTAFGKATVAMKGFTAASLLNPWVALAAGITAATVALVKHSRKNAEFNKSVIAGETTNKEANDRLREMNNKVQELQDRLETEGNGRMIRQLKNQLKAAKIAADDLSLAMKLATTYTVAGVEYDRMTGRPVNAPTSYTPTDYDDPTPDPSGSADTDKDISNEMLQVRIAGLREVITLADVEAKLRNDLLEISLQDLKTNEEILAKAQAHNDAERSRLQIQQQLRDLEVNMTAQIDKAKLALGEITEEEFKQRELQRMRVELQKQFLPLVLAEKFTKEEINAIIEKIIEAQTVATEKSKGFTEQFADGIKSMGDLTGNLANVAVSAFTRMGDTLAEFVTTGKANFADFARSILADLTKIFIRYAMFNALAGIFGPSSSLGKFLGFSDGGVIGGKGGPSTTMPDSVSLVAANGMAFGKNKIVPYAKGGIVKKPTFFQYASGGYGNFGLMGEAGPEAIMPLRRGSNGKLGVEASGAGIGNITVNVDASGSSVEGDAAQSAQLGKAIGIAVKQELVKQKRPGGLLAS
tara:strand:- start:2041 stop:4965 length:2925 start_codon:yes stop_codon:yes gene_type:complete